MTPEKLSEVERLHGMWCRNELGGVRAEFFAADLCGFDFSDVDLVGADFWDSDLRGTIFNSANLHSADFRRANLQEADFSGADLSYASFRCANLQNADLRATDMSYANLCGADLRNANLQRAALSNADLRDANLAGANLSDAILCCATGNMREVKSVQIDSWPCVWTTAPDGVVTLWIGYQSHPLEKWRRADPQWISTMCDGALNWWNRYGAIILSLVDSAPAVRWG